MYTAEISRKRPTLFGFLIDGSGSTSRTLAGGQETIAQRVALALNRLIMELVVRSTKGEDQVYGYYDLAAIVYNGRGVQSGWAGTLAGKEIVSISELAVSPARMEERKRKVDDGAGGVIEVPVRMPIWFEPASEGSTPMAAAFSRAKVLIQQWISEHPDAYPPTLINVSDGDSTDGSPVVMAREIQALVTSDGNVLVFNLHVSPDAVGEILYPAEQPVDRFGATMFDASSELPPHLVGAFAEAGVPIRSGARACTINADMIQVIQALNIGTRPASLE